jgi:hypothetical protein
VTRLNAFCKRSGKTVLHDQTICNNCPYEVGQRRISTYRDCPHAMEHGPNPTLLFRTISCSSRLSSDVFRRTRTQTTLTLVLIYQTIRRHVILTFTAVRTSYLTQKVQLATLAFPRRRAVQYLPLNWITSLSSIPTVSAYTIQSDPGGNANILGGHSIGHSTEKSVYVHVSCSEEFHCTDEQHAISSHELQSALMLAVEFSKMYYTR